MRRLATGLMAAAALAMLATGVHAQDKRKVKIGTEGAYPPFNSIDTDGKLVGFDVDIAKALCAAANFECEFVVQDWDGIIPGLIAKKYDAIVASMSITEQAQGGGRLHRQVLSDAGEVRRGQGRRLRLLARRPRRHGHRRAAGNHSREFRAREVPRGGRAPLRDAGRSQRRSGVRPPRPGHGGFGRPARRVPQDRRGQDFEFVGPDYYDPKYHGEGAGIAMRKGEDDLRLAFNEAIDKIRADGTYQAINEKYFDFDVYGPTS